MVPGRVGIGEEQPGAEPVEPAGERAADVAEPDDPHRQRAQLVAHQLLAHPRALTDPPVAQRSFAEHAEDRHHRPIGDGVAVVAGRVGDRDPILRRRAVIDGVEAHRGLLDQQAVAHVLQDSTVDPVLVALVGAGGSGTSATSTWRGSLKRPRTVSSLYGLRQATRAVIRELRLPLSIGGGVPADPHPTWEGGGVFARVKFIPPGCRGGGRRGPCPSLQTRAVR